MFVFKSSINYEKFRRLLGTRAKRVFDLNIVLQRLSYELVAVSTIVAEVVGFCSAFVSHIEKG